MRVLVSGASGYVGNYVIQALLKKGIEIIATSKTLQKASKFEWFQSVEYVQQDLNERRDDYFQLFSRPDSLVHLAWEGLPNYNDMFHIERNLLSNYYFLKSMIKGGLNRLAVVGTCAEYGLQNGCLSENIATMPANPYAIAKDTLRRMLEFLTNRHDVAFKWIRLFYVYGDPPRKGSVFDQIDAAVKRGDASFGMASGEQLRDYLDVVLAADYISKIVFDEATEGVINCCSGKPISIRRLVEDRLRKMGNTIRLDFGFYPIPEYEPVAFWGDNTKLQDILRRYE